LPLNDTPSQKPEPKATDWEAFFEDPETGVIALITSAKTARALRESALVVVKQLYNRKDDPPEIERFATELQVLVPDDTPDERLPQLIDAVTAILREVEAERIRKAEQHSRDKSVRRDGERRKPSQRVTVHPQGPTGGKRKTAAWLMAGAALAAAAVAAVFLTDQGEKKTTPNQTLIDEMMAVVAGSTIETHVFGGTLRKATMAKRISVTAEGVPGEACGNAAWYFANRGTVVINGFMVRKISPGVLNGLCKREADGATITWIPKEAAK